MKTRLIGSALVLVTLAVVIAYPSFKSQATALPPPVATQAEQVEVVFVLDTTASMSGLIEAAKQKIWAIATTLAQAEQAPSLRMGLVAYRDRGDAYVTEVVDLSTDLDAMYQRLMQFAAAGGGDGPESVNEALAEAVHRISWSQETASYRVVFLVGDAPPHMDYAGEPRYPDIVRDAVAKGIVVNTIQAGDLQQTVEPWTRIAALGNGRYLKVGQSGDTFAVTTPFDEDIAMLSAQLDRTRMNYGSTDEVAEADEAFHDRLRMFQSRSAAEQARRAVYNTTSAGSASLFRDGDLVDDVTRGEIELESLPRAELPEDLRKLDTAAQQAAIAELAEQREALKARIATLNESRAAYIEDRVVEEGADVSLERQIYDVVREQAAPLGLSYEKGPEY
jgi:uncharacterized protein YegL